MATLADMQACSGSARQSFFWPSIQVALGSLGLDCEQAFPGGTGDRAIPRNQPGAPTDPVAGWPGSFYRKGSHG